MTTLLEQIIETLDEVREFANAVHKTLRLVAEQIRPIIEAIRVFIQRFQQEYAPQLINLSRQAMIPVLCVSVTLLPLVDWGADPGHAIVADQIRETLPAIEPPFFDVRDGLSGVNELGIKYAGFFTVGGFLYAAATFFVNLIF